MGISRHLWFVGVAVVLLQWFPGIAGWGQDGHYATCKIAEAFLSEDALAVVKELLPESAQGELAAMCSWPDWSEVRSEYPWSRDLHFSDTPDFACNYDYCRDCHDTAGLKNRCVAGAIYNYTVQLASACRNPTSETRYNLTEALMFLSHFIGDVHQPLHCGFIGDLGGNRIKVTWYSKEINLHRVWDTAIIDSALDTFYGSNISAFIEAIQNNVTENWSNYRTSWGTCESNQTVCPNLYASESISLACKYAYKNATPGSVLEDEYFLSRLPIVEQRLAEGGVRLAATLNRIFEACGLTSDLWRGVRGVASV